MKLDLPAGVDVEIKFKPDLQKDIPFQNARGDPGVAHRPKEDGVRSFQGVEDLRRHGFLRFQVAGSAQIILRKAQLGTQEGGNRVQDL
jgi:hypothetical protein